MLETIAGANAISQKGHVNGVEPKVIASLLRIFGLAEAIIVVVHQTG